MNQVETKQYKSIYHIFIWIGVFSLIMIGLLEWGYIVGGRAFGNYKVYTGLVPWCTWIVMTYLATRPKWFTSRYNLGEMFKVHWMTSGKRFQLLTMNLKHVVKYWKKKENTGVL